MGKNDILANIAKIKHRMANACIECNRDPSSVRLLLATKTVAPSDMRIAIEAGDTLIGENKVQEFAAKAEALRDLIYTRHFIGHLQTNKVKEILQYVHCIQSVDRVSLAEKLQQRLAFENKHLDILVQVNTSYEDSKFGLDPDEALDAVRHIATMDRLHIKGLMTIGLFDADAEKVRPSFRLLRGLRDEIMALHLPDVTMEELSMGMSGDLETAIEEGATIIRVGSAIFGERIY